MIGSLFLMAARLGLGARHLGTALLGWLAAADLKGRARAGAVLGRSLGGTITAGFAGGMLYAFGLLWWGSGAAALISAWVAGRPGGGQDQAPEMEPAAFLELVHDVAGAGNVHLVTIRAQLAEETDRQWSGPQARALCDAAGIPVRDGVRVPGAQPAVTTGIHRADLPPLPRPSSDTPVDGVGAGGGDNNNTNTPTVEEIGGGAAFIITTGPSTRQGVRR